MGRGKWICCSGRCGGRGGGRSGQGWREILPLANFLLPLCVHWVAEEMTVSIQVDVTTAALCPRETTCLQALYINGIQQTVVGIFKMVVLPVLGQLAAECGRKPILLLTVSSTIFPLALLAVNQSKGFVYAYCLLRTADVIEESKRATAFSWITGMFSASHVLGNALARFLPEKYVFYVSIALLIFCPIYMQVFLGETVKSPSLQLELESSKLTKTAKVLQNRCRSMKEAATIVTCSFTCFCYRKRNETLKGIVVVSFFYELGMSGITGVLLYYLKAAFGFNKNQFSEILMLVGMGSIVSQMLVLPLVNPLVGEKAILCTALLASIAYLSRSHTVLCLSASFGVIYILVKPSTYSIISKALSSTDQGKAQGFIAEVQSIANLLSPLAMSPLTSWFLSSDAPFNCKGFIIVCASICMVVSLCYACTLKEPSWDNADDVGDAEAPLLGNRT
ncbi:hypothetical protein MLD38_008596 [Melastoma candidum]|uniref:Uncharacterized protein n=1 Tax=Melastoma candidum TaxID=119954 RepID=A0ACB9RUT4_9MYRT|nr:hypothetical protein MLD38_008596 [Melastoma candidum]